jgi:aspartyl aminopeptidase
MSNALEKSTIEEMNEVQVFAEGYKDYLTNSKTESETVFETIKIAESNGFIFADTLKSIKPGDKIYYLNRTKNIVLIVVGKNNILNGINLIASHIDSPRLDLKPNPIHEDSDSEIAVLKTHYYGWLKKYQWASRPLAIHGEIILKSGKRIQLKIGEKESDPVFVIGDLLPHLDKNVKRGRTAWNVLKGEELQVIIGSIPYMVKDKNISGKIKLNVLEYLKRNYGIEEDDLYISDIEIVPSGNARDIGFDKGLIGAYGQDDRICAYTSLKAILELSSLSTTAVCYFADREEIGSIGNTGANGKFLEYVIGNLIEKLNGSFNENMLRKTFWKSYCISADVTVGVDPVFKEVHDLTNAAKLNHGLAVLKYGGVDGKENTHEAGIEFMHKFRTLLNENKVNWQTGNWGKIDEATTGTVGRFIDSRGIQTVDAGPALIGMHSPFEISSKFDVYQCYRAYKAFFEDMQ